MARHLTAATAICLLLLWAATSLAIGAEPTSPPDPLFGGDPRSDGAGPGVVGSPILILGAVVLLGVTTAFVTIVIARLAQRR